MSHNTRNTRMIVPKLMQSISILYQNGEITTAEKDSLCKSVREALVHNDLSDLHNRFRTLRYGTMFPDIVEECLQLLN